MTIVRSHYRYKPPPRRKKTMPLEAPAVVAIDRKTRRRVPDKGKTALVESTPANDDRKPAAVTTEPAKPVPSPTTTARPSAIVTARRPGKRYAEMPEVSEDEHRRVGDLADAMMAEFKRVIAARDRQAKG
jgi:hypothetical protein